MSETETGRLTPGIVAAVVCLIVFMGIVLPVTASMSSLIPTDRTMDNSVGSERAVMLEAGEGATWVLDPAAGTLSLDGGDPVHVDSWFLYTARISVVYPVDGRVMVFQQAEGSFSSSNLPLKVVAFPSAASQSVRFLSVQDGQDHNVASDTTSFALASYVPGLGMEANYGYTSGSPAAVIGGGSIVHVVGDPQEAVGSRHYVKTLWYAADPVFPGGVNLYVAHGNSSDPYPMDVRYVSVQTSETDGQVRVDSLAYSGDPHIEGDPLAGPLLGWWVPLTWTAPGEPSTVAAIVGMVPVILLAGLVAGVCGWAVARPRRSLPASSRSSPFSDGWRDAR